MKYNCKNGANCKFLLKGKCKFYHTKEEKLINKKIKKIKKIKHKKNLHDNNLITVIAKPRIRMAYKGCEDCTYGCKKCMYPRKCGIEYITKPTQLTREISCKTCGKYRESDINVCTSCGSY